MEYPGIESSILEFKSQLPTKQQILNTVIAFCNNFGGRLIIGVDNGGQVIGVPDDRINEIIESLHQSIYQSATPVILPMIYTQRIENKLIVIIEVSAGMNKPYFRTSEGMNNGTYFRVGSHTVKATPEVIQELQWQSRGFYADEIPVYNATIEDINLDRFIDFLKKRRHDYDKPDINKMLLQYQLVVEEHKRLYPTKAGILMFGYEPQKFISESFIICTHFKGTSGREALASRDCDGTLMQQLNDSLAFLESRLNKSFTIKRIKREERLEIPLKALREIVMNAIVHRNYQIPGPTKMAIYDDRIEIFSPGNFPGPLQTDDFRNGNYLFKKSSYLQNFS